MLERRKDAAARGTVVDLANTGEVRLLAQIQRQDRQAFETLYRAYFPRLARFLDRMTRSASLIEEIINDTMLVVWQRADTFNHTSKVSTWIFAIAYRKALKAVSAFDDPVEDRADEEAGEQGLEPDQILSRQQLQQQVARALDALPILQRTVVNLTYYHGMAYEEIAAVMECPVNTVKTRMFNARLRLKHLLAESLEHAP